MARERAARDRIENARFIQADAQVYPFEPAAYDVVLSRTGAMFFADQLAAFTNIRRALRAGGRLVMVSWRSAAENEWIRAMREALLPGVVPPEPPADGPNPFRHADRDGTRRVLQQAGLVDVEFEPVDTDMYFGADAAEGFPIMRDLLGWMLHGLDESESERALDRLRRLFDTHQTADGVALRSAAWLITARRL